MVLSASAIINALLHVSTPIHIANFPKKRTTQPKGMLIGVGTYLPDVVVHLVQAAIILDEGKKKENWSVADPVAFVHYGEKNGEITRWTVTKKS